MSGTLRKNNGVSLAAHFRSQAYGALVRYGEWTAAYILMFSLTLIIVFHQETRTSCDWKLLSQSHLKCEWAIEKQAVHIQQHLPGYNVKGYCCRWYSGIEKELQLAPQFFPSQWSQCITKRDVRPAIVEPPMVGILHIRLDDKLACTCAFYFISHILSKVMCARKNLF